MFVAEKDAKHRLIESQIIRQMALNQFACIHVKGQQVTPSLHLRVYSRLGFFSEQVDYDILVFIFWCFAPGQPALCDS